MVTAFGWRLHRHYRGPQFLIDTTNTGWILLSGQKWIPLLGHQWVLFHGHGQKLVLSEAPIPDPVIYTFPALTAQGPGGWHFGFFALSNGMPEEMIAGRERTWVGKFVDALEVVKGSVTDDDLSIYASYLSEPARLNALLAWFRSFPQDMLDTKEFRKRKLPMPVLAIGAQGSLGDFVPNQVREYANDVTGLVIPDSGHWLYEERPAEMITALLAFLEADG